MLGFCAGLLVVPERLRYYADLRGLEKTELARRLAGFHGVSCRPEHTVTRDGALAVWCAGGHHVVFHAALPCEASFACASLGIDAACYALEIAPP